MSLTLKSIHQPLADFFLNLFNNDPEGSILFRFDKYGSVLSDKDFMDPNHPELGYLPTLAMEKFSDLVNHIPIDNHDGLNITLTKDLIDETYFFRLLEPSNPYILDKMDEATKQAIITNFGLTKNDALKKWQNITFESSTGQMLQYKPSLATPTNWYDKSNNEVWTTISFQITETSSTSTPNLSNLVWKLKLSEAEIQQIQDLPAPEPVMSQNVQPHLPMKGTITTHSIDLGSQTISVHGITNPDGPPQKISPVIDNGSLSKQLILNQLLSERAPTQSVKTTNISISFDYCLVYITRNWYESAFINMTSWYVPTLLKGQVTSDDLAGSLTWMPIAFVAIRNLNIEADWATEDITNASIATDFGPFRVSTEIANNKISHEDVQIFAWLLQKMPDLPPASDPNQQG